MLLILKNKRIASDNIENGIDLIGNHLEKSATPFVVSSFEDVEVYIETNNTTIDIDGRSLNDFNAIFVRKVGSYYNAAFILAFYAKQHSIEFVDDFRNKTRNRTKLVQMILLSSKGISIPKTYFSPNYDNAHLTNAIEFLQFPIVVKQCGTSKGKGVALAKTHKELLEKIQFFQSETSGKTIILQEFIPNTFEYRVLVTGNTIATAEKKYE
jgi:glutathione synthase/RimK-type ligase-like ATP-grasp enzyme